MLARKIVLTAAAALLLAGCGRSGEEQVVYCSGYKNGIGDATTVFRDVLLERLASIKYRREIYMSAGQEALAAFESFDQKLAEKLRGEEDVMTGFARAVDIAKKYESRIEPARADKLYRDGTAAGKDAAQHEDVDNVVDTFRACSDAYHSLSD